MWTRRARLSLSREEHIRVSMETHWQLHQPKVQEAGTLTVEQHVQLTENSDEGCPQVCSRNRCTSSMQVWQGRANEEEPEVMPGTGLFFFAPLALEKKLQAHCWQARSAVTAASSVSQKTWETIQERKKSGEATSVAFHELSQCASGCPGSIEGIGLHLCFFVVCMRRGVQSLSFSTMHGRFFLPRDLRAEFC